MSLLIANPLPSALSHYQNELRDTLLRCDVRNEILQVRPVEGLQGFAGKLKKLLNAVNNTRIDLQPGQRVLQCWASLGLLEPQLWRSSGGRNIVVIHDPIPIRRQVGYDPVSKVTARRLHDMKSPKLLVHSDDAFVATRKVFPKADIVKALHPILSDTDETFQAGKDIIVAGQYKPERNLGLLVQLGPLLRAKGFRPRILGRGWPSKVPGWHVDSRFLTEAELDAALDDAAVVLIPYRTYFQSGIAIRALERGRLSVSPDNSFARDTFKLVPESIYRASASPQEVLEHLCFIADSQDLAQKVYSDYKARCDDSWRLAFAD